MRSELLDLAAKLASAREPFVVAVVVRREPASSAQVGNMAVISVRGEFHGWLGGSCIRPTIVREAQAALADGQPRLVSLSPDPSADTRPGVSVLPMTCHSGGTVDIYVEPVLPEPELLVFGTTPVARALARLGKGMGYSVDVVDPEADAAMFPDADTCGAKLQLRPGRADRGVGAAPEVRCSALRVAIVATHGERDEEAIAEAIETRPDYLGVVASRKRFAQIRETLVASGVSAAALERVRNPAGLDIGAKTPEEIALSILAEVVQVRRQVALGQQAEGAGREAEGQKTVGQQAVANPPSAPLPSVVSPHPAEAIDPVCGMTVRVAAAKHTAEHGGRTFYFCCGGCRQRFLVAPAQYEAALPR